MKMEPMRRVEIKEEANGEETDDELYIDDLIKEEETDTDDNVVSDVPEGNAGGKKNVVDFGMGYGHFLATEYNKQGDQSRFQKQQLVASGLTDDSDETNDGYLGYSREDLINDDLLKELPVRALNQRLKWLTKEDIAALKLKRRTLKNRDYARTSRQKRVTKIQELELANRGLREELARLRRELAFAVAERDRLRAKYEPERKTDNRGAENAKELKEGHSVDQKLGGDGRTSAREDSLLLNKDGLGKSQPFDRSWDEPPNKDNKKERVVSLKDIEKRLFDESFLRGDQPMSGEITRKEHPVKLCPRNSEAIDIGMLLTAQSNEKGQPAKRKNFEEVQPADKKIKRNDSAVGKDSSVNEDGSIVGVEVRVEEETKIQSKKSSVEPDASGVVDPGRSLGTVQQAEQTEAKEDHGDAGSTSESMVEDPNVPTLEEECLDMEEEVEEMEDPLMIPVEEPEEMRPEGPIDAYRKVREFELKLRKSGDGVKNSSLILDALMGANGADPKTVPALERFERLFQEKDLEKRSTPPHGRVKKTPIKRRLKNKIEIIDVTEKKVLSKRVKKKRPPENVEEFVPPPEDIFSQSVPIRSQLDLLLDKPP